MHHLGYVSALYGTFLSAVLLASLMPFLDALASLDFTLVSRWVAGSVVVSNLGAFKPVYIR